MSHEVLPQDLEAAATPYGPTPYLLYVGSKGTARVNHVHTTVTSTDNGATVECSAFGRGIPSIVEAGGDLSLLWPAHTEGDFSLIADGTGVMANNETLTITISSAVLHRPAPTTGAPASC